MVSLARFTPKPGWLCVLCAIALGLSLAAPVLAEATGGSPAPLTQQRNSEDNLPAFHAEAFDLTDDSALPTTADLLGWRPVVFALNIALPVEWAWFPAPPVRPPIVSNSI